MQEDTIGKRIARSRKKRHLTQRQLALLIRVGTNTVSMYENDIRKPSAETIIRLARALHVTTDYLLIGENRNFIDGSGLADRHVQLLHELADDLREKSKTDMHHTK